ncbi:MAG: Gfo/Idh/MocA family oxidoreductase [Bacteroidota bacterium]|nr:Gfo/Idh/MocA family oxidoreductase [Bacteroidota bacterium]
MTFLICGLGSIGKRHLRILKGLGRHKFIALRSGNSKADSSEKADEEITNLKDISGYKIDGALITNPTSLHITTAIEIAKYGIPLFIEKPLSKNLVNIIELKNLVAEKKFPVLLGYNLIYHPGIQSIKKCISEKKIGKVVSARAQFGTYMPDWHKNEDYKKSYAANASMGGGVVLTSIHEQNYLTEMFGKVTDVKAMELGGSSIGIEVEEGIEILMKHSSGVVSNIHLNFFQKPYYRNCEVIGTEGTIYWDFMKPEIKILFKDKTEVIKLGKGPIELLDESYSNQMKHFIDVIEKKDEPKISLIKGIEDMEVALKILKEIGRNYN